MEDKHDSDLSRISYACIIEKKLAYLTQNAIVSLLIIGAIALAIRLYFFPYGVPITLDGLLYFWYSNDLSITGQYPAWFQYPNNGWPTFVAVFFSIFHFNNYLDYMTVQRLVSVAISVLTIIPVYLLCRRFFDKPYALVGAALFAFEPRVIQNSVLGITDPAYVILVTTALYLFLSSNKKIIYLSFIASALSALVRYEGVFSFFVISIMFFVRFRKERKVVLKYGIALGIFILVLLPMTLIRVQYTGENGLTNQLEAGANAGFVLTENEHNKTVAWLLYLVGGFANLIKYLGWVMIPFFVFFVPIGACLILKNRNHNNMTMILAIIILSVPALYAYSRGIQDTRYLFSLYPSFCILSIVTIKKVSTKINNQNLFLVLIICGILLSSVIYLEFKKTDYVHEREAFSIAGHVISMAKGVNDYYPESDYIPVAEMPEKWPALRSSIQNQTSIIPIQGFDSLEKYIESSESKGLTHLILDGKSSRPSFLNDVFYHEEKYPYLEKVYDSKDYGYKYDVKIYKIDYERFGVNSK